MIYVGAKYFSPVFINGGNTGQIIICHYNGVNKPGKIFFAMPIIQNEI